MIGQERLMNWLDKQTDEILPHFIVLVGDKGSGKRTFAKYIANHFNFIYSECDIKVDMVREVIGTANQSTTKVLYCFADADNMRNEAKNAMLKITEEPPKNAWFIMTVQNDYSLLDTIKSRALVLHMNKYTEAELSNYANNETLGSICSTPGEVDLMKQYGQEFYDYVELVIDNIAEVEPANAFKSSQKLAIKTDEGYDLQLFFKVFIKVCFDRLQTHGVDYAHGILVATTALKLLKKQGANKQQIYDMFVLEIRKEWY